MQAGDGQLRVGDELAGYRLTHLLGEGGMATVFRGENLLDPGIVRAIKVMHPELGSRRELVKRFAAEATVLEKLSHPNIVRFFGVRQERGHLIMELELLQGGTLASRLEPGLPLGDVVGWMLQATCGVIEAHAQGVLHRDIKPDNLFLTDQGTVKVLDFGIARALLDTDRATRQTAEGTAPGTAEYMAPEVCRGATATAAADVYALGLTLLELAMGHHPFLSPGQSRSALQLMFMHVQESVPSLRSVRPDAPLLLDQVVARATAKDPASRYASALELAGALQAALEVLHGRAPVSVPRTSFEHPHFDPKQAPPPGSIRPADIPRSYPGQALPPGSIRSTEMPPVSATSFELPQFAPRQEVSAPASDVVRPDVVRPDAVPAKPRALLYAGGALALLVAAVAGVGAMMRHRGDVGVKVDAAGSASVGQVAVLLTTPQVAEGGSCPGGMAAIPAGSFMMGSNESSDEKPVHRAEVGAFCMDVTEVTTEAYAACVAAGKCSAASTLQYCNAGQAGRGNHPINCVDWNQATAYCAWASKRLPTEEEWEYGARGAEGLKYPWGSTPEPGAELCWDGNGNDLGKGKRKSTCAVGSYPAGKSPFGLMDMAGNVWEWTASGYSDDYSKGRVNAARVNHGGGWNNDDPAVVRSANRSRDAPAVRYNNLGFRCAR